METLRFEININAKAELVFAVLIDAKHFEDWSKIFSPTSRIEGTWEKGSIMQFLSTETSGVCGLLSKVEDIIPNKNICLAHFGFIQNGKWITEGPEVESLIGAYEKYSFREDQGYTLLKVETDIFGDFSQFFKDTWPKALTRLKEICETQL